MFQKYVFGFMNVKFQFMWIILLIFYIKLKEKVRLKKFLEGKSFFELTPSKTPKWLWKNKISAFSF